MYVWELHLRTDPCLVDFIVKAPLVGLLGKCLQPKLGARTQQTLFWPMTILPLLLLESSRVVSLARTCKNPLCTVGQPTAKALAEYIYIYIYIYIYFIAYMAGNH